MSFTELWNQLDLVEQQLTKGFELYKETKQFLSSFFGIENVYSKNLSGISQISEVRAKGVLQESWESMKTEFLSSSKYHKSMSTFTNDLINKLTKQIEVYEKETNRIISGWKLDRRLLNKASEKHILLKNKYLKKAHNLEFVTIEWEKLLLSNSATEKEIIKLYSKRKTLKKEVSEIFLEYKNAVEKLNEKQQQYKKDVGIRLTEIDQLETNRIRDLKESMEQFLDASTQVNTSSQKSFTEISSTISEINSNTLITKFVLEKQSGKPLLEMPELLPQRSDNEISKTNNIPKQDEENVKNSSRNFFSRRKTKKYTKQQISEATSTSTTISNKKDQDSQSSTVKTDLKPEKDSELKTEEKIKENNEDNKEPEENPIFFEAQYSYEKTEEGELSFQEGDSVKILDQDSSGWWKAEIDGIIGFVPSTYFNSENLSENEENDNQDQEEAQNIKVGDYVQLQYAFNNGEEDELICEEGEVLVVLGISDGWFKARNVKDEEGLVPSNYVTYYQN
ncbi:fch and double sh3 domains protein [Anaeramoeba flamelloides]|uniref:Fch and double sh3 domains protein n=1 Tax=Anaeramoeba flamelloides TaxID=1746091 RepID=A0AAV7ZVY4_9EUKA|nr:fch and double sh3 domains protein [Anaeramoeba flamelloides]